jgi:eukaryotic-like serine/threonine-protein kinase
MSTEKLSRGGKSVAGFALGASPSYEDAMSSVATSLEQTDQYGETTSVALTDAQLSAPLGSLDFGACGAPDDMKLTVQVAVKGGRAVGVTVETDPSNKSVASCIDRAVRKLRWPSSPKLDSFTTRY